MRRLVALQIGLVQLLEELVGALGMVADQHHVTSRTERGPCALGHRAGHARALHAQVVAEDHALEAESRTQHILEPERREAGRVRVHLRIDHVRRHDGCQRVAHPVIRPRVVGQNLVKSALIDWHGHVRIGLDEAMTREMLAAVAHAGQQQAVREMVGQHRYHPRIGVKRAVTDHGAAAMVEIEHRREAQVDVARAQFGRQHVAARNGDLGGRHHIAIPQFAESCHRWQMREAIGLGPLYAATFMVDADQHVFAHSANRPRQRGQLGARLEIPREQDHAARQRMGDTTHVLGIELLANHVEHHRARTLAGNFLVHRNILSSGCVGSGCVAGRLAAPLRDGEGHRVLVFVTDTDPDGQPAFPHPFGQLASALRRGLARRQVQQFHGAPRHRPAHAQADSLRERLLGREPRGQEGQPALLRARLARMVDLQFARTEHLLGKSAARALHHALHAIDLDDVSADAVDHAACPGTG
ncbi:hypothetical protein D3C87_1155930 [compost metagenome]